MLRVHPANRSGPQRRDADPNGALREPLSVDPATIRLTERRREVMRLKAEQTIARQLENIASADETRAHQLERVATSLEQLVATRRQPCRVT